MTELVAYVDGSYDKTTEKFSYGAVLLDSSKEILLSQAYNNSDLATMHNVAGEIIGAMSAMKYAADHGYKALELYYDYEGIEKWCTGEWKCRKKATQLYRQFYESVSSSLTVTFRKIKAHSGDYYNEKADRLAKAALK